MITNALRCAATVLALCAAPAMAYAASAAVAPTGGYADSPEHKTAVIASRPYMSCVLRNAKALGVANRDDAAVTVAAKKACAAELKAYSDWFSGKSYSGSQKGMELTLVQRTMDKVGPQAAALGRTPAPAH